MTIVVISMGILLGTGGQVLVDRMARKRPQVAEWWFGCWMVIAVILSALSFAQGQPLLGAWLAICAAADCYMWWQRRKRRKRKRAMGLLGAKSRALITKLVMRQREAGSGA